MTHQQRQNLKGGSRMTSRMARTCLENIEGEDGAERRLCDGDSPATPEPEGVKNDDTESDPFAFAKKPGKTRLKLWPSDVDGLVDAVASVPDENGRRLLLGLAEATDQQENVTIGFIERVMSFAPDERTEFISRLSARL